MTVISFKQEMLVLLYDIDIRSYDWPWHPEGWDDISKYVLRVLWTANNLTGFSVFRFAANSRIIISKLTVHPLYRDGGGVESLLKDIENTAKRQNIAELRISIWEHDDFRIKEVKSLGFNAIGLGVSLPDGSDSYEFMKKVNYGC